MSLLHDSKERAQLWASIREYHRIILVVLTCAVGVVVVALSTCSK